MTTLLVCSGGGHLRQMWSLRPRLGLVEAPVWVTFDSPQSRSLLADEDVVYTPYAASRDLPNSARIARIANTLMRDRHIDRVVSTGASVAVSFMLPARARRITCHYVESAARSDGPSLSGRMVAAIPGVNLYSQYPAWAGGRWHYAGSVFDGYSRGADVVGAPEKPRKVVVTLGTLESYGFRRAVERLIATLPSDADVLWQTGITDVTGLGIDARESVPARELSDAVAQADLVVAHSGTGSALTAMDAGKCAVLLPRLAIHGEHIDDHQLQIAGELDRRGLALACAVEDLDSDVFTQAMRRTVAVGVDPPPFRLLRDTALEKDAALAKDAAR